MDLREITADFAVAPQIGPEDVPALARAGYRHIICNRPDEEVAAPLSHSRMAEAAQAAGLSFHYLPYYPGALTEELISGFTALLDGLDGPVFAYCRSGTRCSHLWSMREAGRRPTEEILSLAARAGYDNTALTPMLRVRAAGG